MSQVVRVAVIGGESTGKSALCRDLALHYRTSWVPEFAREYLNRLGGKYTEEDLLRIAEGQRLSEEAMLPLASRMLFCDTDLSVIRLWSETAYGRCHPQILTLMESMVYDAFLVTAPDLPWEPDPLREHPDPVQRRFFFSWYCGRAAHSGKPWAIIRGQGDERLQSAVRFVDEYMKHYEDSAPGI